MLCFIYLINFHSDSMEIVTLKGGRFTRIYSNLAIESKNMYIEAYEAILGDDSILIRGDVKGRVYNKSFKCDSIIFIFPLKISYLLGDVEIEGKGMVLKSDRFIFNHRDNLLKTDQRVSILNRKDNITVEGGYMEYHNDTDSGFITRKPYIVVDDSVTITSDTFYLLGNRDVIYGRGGVVIEFSDGSVRGENLDYRYRDGEGVMYGDVFFKKGDVEGVVDTVYMFGDGNGVDSLHLRGNLRMKASVSGGEVRIECGLGKVYVEDGRMARILFSDNPKGEYRER